MPVIRPVWPAVLGGIAVVAVATGCAGGGPSTPPPPTGATASVTESNPPGDIPDNQAFVAYTAADGSYTLKYPEGWTRTDSATTVTFSDKYNDITVAPHNGFYLPPRCTPAPSKSPRSLPVLRDSHRETSRRCNGRPAR